ncbi:MAG TPA: hypothetical protein VH914_18265 [Acidimicrobiia bacterium]|jgi:hypothetical protein|nr:hypothetical protein [Acidimicrobiia bacterium]
MWERGGKAVVALGALALAIVGVAPPAGAKVLPIASVSVSTPTPTVGKPFTVGVRFQPGKDFGDYPWENNEVFVLPAARADAQGWPLSNEDRGKAIPIHRVAFGRFRGTAVVRTPGDYVVIDGSGLSARVERAQGVVNIPGTYASPVRLHVVRAATGSAWPSIVVTVAIVVALAVAALMVAMRRRRRAPGTVPEAEELVYAGR